MVQFITWRCTVHPDYLDVRVFRTPRLPGRHGNENIFSHNLANFQPKPFTVTWRWTCTEHSYYLEVKLYCISRLPWGWGIQYTWLPGGWGIQYTRITWMLRYTVNPNYLEVEVYSTPRLPGGWGIQYTPITWRLGVKMINLLSRCADPSEKGN